MSILHIVKEIGMLSPSRDCK